jgi:Putative transposase
VLRYLGRYTHRVAISNHRLVSFADGKVAFRWRDSAHNNEQKLMTLSLDEFLRRFLLHLLPKGFVRIPNFGPLANRRRATTLPLCFQLLGSAPQAKAEASIAGSSDAWPLPQMWWTDAAHRKDYSGGAPAPFSADPGGRRRMNVDRHYETFLCFRSLTLFVSCCPTNSFSPIPKVILEGPHLSFQQLLGSHVWVLCFSASPAGCCHTYSSSIEFAEHPRPPQPRAASFKSLYRKRAIPPCSCPHFSVRASDTALRHIGS